MTRQPRGPQLGGIHNVRDLGGHPLPGGGETREGVFLRGDALRGVDTDGLRALLDGGLTTIVDLRSHAEVEEGPNPLAGHDAVTYHHLPLYDGLQTIEAMALGHAGGFDMGLRYRAGLEQCGPAFAQALRYLAAAEGTALFHCTAGKDRTGIMAALLLGNAGVEAEHVAEDYGWTATHGAGLIGVLRERALARGSEPAHAERVLASAPPTMLATLVWLEDTFGGASAYMERIGLDAGERGVLREKLAG
ncbi:hypothetical protein ATO6_02080 [Oceanicola sp. 22II-s10i]|uniref:tyrosine-protein phosphatase n=1 Tax=Oceanicola sp. 22II-s10i TaxID=1317116 RepID=UPI000B524BA5|nr:tyrosine-protein phosphatase [Oceanicola sp. 22II-s10i]OWU85727.1 hypothetical protein ATO6_02080 [Oceanicola sp. 22II-s10i]